MVLVDILVFFFPPQINRIRSSLSVLDTTREVHWGVVTSPPPAWIQQWYGLVWSVHSKLEKTGCVGDGRFESSRKFEVWITSTLPFRPRIASGHCMQTLLAASQQIGLWLFRRAHPCEQDGSVLLSKIKRPAEACSEKLEKTLLSPAKNISDEVSLKSHWSRMTLLPNVWKCPYVGVTN